LLVREEHLRDIRPVDEVRIHLTPQDLAVVPPNTEVEMFIRLRWPAGGKTRQATCVQRVVFARGRHVAGAGTPAGEPVELTDMGRFRSFWNKVWSSHAPTDDTPLWGVDLTLRYSVILIADATGNGLMEARTKSNPHDGGLRNTASGKMKSGLEASIHELNKLAGLWPEAHPLDDATLAAFAAPGWRATQGGDAEAQVRFDGRRHSRGMVWVVPVMSLRQFPVARASEADAYGQIVATAAEQVAFPVIEAVRVLGLASHNADAGEPTTSEDGSEYAFEGYQVVRDLKVGLEPATPPTNAAEPAPRLAVVGSAP
jgi:hypothetical protein